MTTIDKTKVNEHYMTHQEYVGKSMFQKNWIDSMKEGDILHVTSDKSASEQLKTFSYKTWVKTYWKVVTIRTKEKSKDVSVSNLGWIVGVVVLGGLALLFGFLYAKTKRKLVNATSVF